MILEVNWLFSTLLSNKWSYPVVDTVKTFIVPIVLMIRGGLLEFSSDLFEFSELDDF